MTDLTTTTTIVDQLAQAPLWFQFILADQSPLVLAMSVALIFFVPFGIIGIVRTWIWFWDNYIKPGRGYIKVRRKLSNGRWLISWNKVFGNSIKIKVGKFETDIPLNFNKDFVGFEKNVPFVELDETLNQMRLDRTQTVIPANEQTKMSYLAYQAGKLSVFLKQQNMELMIMLVLVITIAVGGGNLYLAYQNYQLIKEQLVPQLGALNSQLSVYQNITGPSVPVVGG